MRFIFAGFVTLSLKPPRNIAVLDVLGSFGSKPGRYRTGSVRAMDMATPLPAAITFSLRNFAATDDEDAFKDEFWDEFGRRDDGF